MCQKHEYIDISRDTPRLNGLINSVGIPLIKKKKTEKNEKIEKKGIAQGCKSIYTGFSPN